MEYLRNAAYAVGLALPLASKTQAMLTPLVCPCAQDLPVSKLATLASQAASMALGIAMVLVCMLVLACAKVA